MDKIINDKNELNVKNTKFVTHKPISFTCSSSNGVITFFVDSLSSFYTHDGLISFDTQNFYKLMQIRLVSNKTWQRLEFGNKLKFDDFLSSSSMGASLLFEKK